MGRNGSAGLGWSLALVMVVAACATGGAGPTAAPTATPAAEGAASLALFTGRDECRDVPQTDPSAADDAEAITCDRVVTDARLSGTLLSEGQPHGVGQDPAFYTAWLRLTITNDGGTWSCDEITMGVIESGTGWRDQVCIGEGAYEGLTAYIHSISNDGANVFGVLGWVEATP